MDMIFEDMISEFIGGNFVLLLLVFFIIFVILIGVWIVF